ncbi:lysophospholipase [Aquabacterium sp.]|uniref:alpha/beta hydrolase n=1 Tax=Aquabacterium sp. TaxID=1872578 RepID=UPI003783B84F
MPTLQTGDGLALHLRHWPVRDGARGTVLIVHGLGEHIGRYAHVVEHLNRCGWQVTGYDQRGHGASGGQRGAIAAADSLLADLGAVIDALRQLQPGPLVLLGHSMGGLVAGRFVAEALAEAPAPWSRAVEALVMSSPALDPGMNAFQKGLLAVLGPLMPNLAVGNGLDPRWVSRDPAVVRAYRRDPLVHDRITPRLARFIVEAGARVIADAPRWQLPTLLLYAGADRCVAPRGSDAFAAAAPPGVLVHQRYEGLAHEIFNEPEQAQVLADLARWLSAHGLSKA